MYTHNIAFFCLFVTLPFCLRLLNSVRDKNDEWGASASSALFGIVTILLTHIYFE